MLWHRAPRISSSLLLSSGVRQVKHDGDGGGRDKNIPGVWVTSRSLPDDKSGSPKLRDTRVVIFKLMARYNKVNGFMIAIRGTSRTDCRASTRVDESHVVRRNEYTSTDPLLRRASASTFDGSCTRVYRSWVLHVDSHVSDRFSPFSRAREEKNREPRWKDSPLSPYKTGDSFA